MRVLTTLEDLCDLTEEEIEKALNDPPTTEEL